MQTSKTSLRSVRLNSPPELGSKKTLHLFIIFFIFANIQNFQKIRLCYIVPQNWGLVEHFRFWPWSSFCKHAKLRLNVMLIFNMKVLIKILLWACSSFKIIRKIRFKQFNPSILELLRSTNTTHDWVNFFIIQVLSEWVILAWQWSYFGPIEIVWEVQIWVFVEHLNICRCSHHLKMGTSILSYLKLSIWLACKSQLWIYSDFHFQRKCCQKWCSH